MYPKPEIPTYKSQLDMPRKIDLVYERVNLVYENLENQTEKKNTRKQSEFLWSLLQLFEYIKGDSDNDPLVEFFND